MLSFSVKRPTFFFSLLARRILLFSRSILSLQEGMIAPFFSTLWMMNVPEVEAWSPQRSVGAASGAAAAAVVRAPSSPPRLSSPPRRSPLVAAKLSPSPLLSAFSPLIRSISPFAECRLGMLYSSRGSDSAEGWNEARENRKKREGESSESWRRSETKRKK